MRHFDEIYALAEANKGSAAAVEAEIPQSTAREDLALIGDDRWLSRFSKHVFSAGFNWKVIENKWPGFEEAFHGFDVARCAMMDDAWFDALLQDTRIVRHGAKIQSVRDNAVFLQDLAAEHGSAAKAFATWPATDYVGLLDLLKKRGTRLGGNTGSYALRFMGVDSLIFSTDVVARLVAEGVVDKAPTSKTAQRAAQEAVNTWMQQSGRGLTAVSRVLAMSVR